MWTGCREGGFLVGGVEVWVHYGVGALQSGCVAVWGYFARVGELRCGKVVVWGSCVVGELRCGVVAELGSCCVGELWCGGV